MEGSAMSIVSDYAESNGDAFGYDFRASGSSLNMLAGIGAPINSGSVQSVLQVNQWQHVCASWSKGVYDFYVNGKWVGGKVGDDSIGPKGSIAYSSSEMTIGGNAASPFIGAIDQVQVYSVALTASQVQWIWALQDSTQSRVRFLPFVPVADD